MTEPERLRKRVQDDRRPADPARRGCLLIGAFLGVAVGVVVALFLVPPLFDRYFGTADIALGDTHAADGKRLRVDRYQDNAGAGGTEIIVTMTITSEAVWDLSMPTITLELEDGTIVGGVAVRGGPRVPAGEAGLDADFEFQRPAGNTARPKLISFSEPKARYYLQPGKPR